MKHLLIASLLIIVLIGVTGCGRQSEPASTSSANGGNDHTPAPVETAPATPTEPLVEPVEAEPVEPAAEPVEASGGTEGKPVVVEFWTGDNQPSRVAAYEAVAQRFMAENPGVDVRIVPLDETGFADKLVAAVADGEGPDLARIGLERLAVLVGNNLVDMGAAGAVVDAVGRDDFREQPLEMVTSRTSGEVMAVPYDGWIQALWYRRDLFEQNELNGPISWDDINAACDKLVESGDVKAGLVLPTAVDQDYVQQVFEQVAMSNNAWPFDAEGNVTMDTPEMVEALRFYTGLQRCSTPAPQDLYDAREAYESGQSGMLFYSTYIMDDLIDGSEREDGTRVQIAVDDLSRKSGFASGMVGPNGSATYGQLVTLALLKDAPPEAQDVAAYFLTKGYYDIIKTAPLGKVPVLKSAIENWTALSPVFTHYSDATLGHIATGYDVMSRWIFRPEYGPVERLTVGKVQSQLLVPQAIDQIVSGAMTPEEAATWLQEQTEEVRAEFEAQG